jgi:hypothetical protein
LLLVIYKILKFFKFFQGKIFGTTKWFENHTIFSFLTFILWCNKKPYTLLGVDFSELLGCDLFMNGCGFKSLI